jgi:hypothetical protein
MQYRGDNLQNARSPFIAEPVDHSPFLDEGLAQTVLNFLRQRSTAILCRSLKPSPQVGGDPRRDSRGFVGVFPPWDRASPLFGRLFLRCHGSSRRKQLS